MAEQNVSHDVRVTPVQEKRNLFTADLSGASSGDVTMCADPRLHPLFRSSRIRRQKNNATGMLTRYLFHQLRIYAERIRSFAVYGEIDQRSLRQDVPLLLPEHFQTPVDLSHFNRHPTS